ncbi:DNA repair protein RecO [Patescibacteria group bacterium]|nr:DNA repair protein RecO [Patescibacteria group bacterium]
MAFYRTTGIILRKINLQDHHKIATILTRERGKVKGVCRGVRKIKSKLAPHLEVGVLSELILVEGKKDLDTITAAKSVEVFKNIRADLKKASFLYYLCEIVDLLTPDQHQDEAVFNLMVEALTHLNKADKKDKELSLLLSFKLKLLNLMGYLPEFYVCLSCGQAVTEKEHRFSYSRGGLVCLNCPKESQEVLLNSSEVKIMRFFSRDSFDQINALNLASYNLERIKTSLDYYFQYLFSKKIKSTGFLQDTNPKTQSLKG